MKILLLMDPFIPVPPKFYGGIERVIADIAEKYHEMGHEVTLVAGPNSQSPGRLIVYGENNDTLTKQLNYKNLVSVTKILMKEIGRHDVVHNFGRLAWLFPIALSKIKKVQTYMRWVDTNNISWARKIGMRNIIFTAVSDAIVKTGIGGGGEWKTVYNCAPVDQFTFNENVNASTAPLAFLGRLERCKGVHSAIAAAKIAGRQLLIAGTMSPLPKEIEYFEKEIKPLIDGDQIKYIGAVDNVQKNKLLGEAAAMLLPIEWYEPFPIVLPESFACGTPVIAFKNGGVPEGIRHGETGYLCDTPQEMADYVKMLPSIRRSECRKDALEKYSDTVIANQYLNIYKN